MIKLRIGSHGVNSVVRVQLAYQLYLQQLHQQRMSEAGMSIARLSLFSVEVVVNGLEAEVVSLFIDVSDC